MTEEDRLRMALTDEQATAARFAGQTVPAELLTLRHRVLAAIRACAHQRPQLSDSAEAVYQCALIDAQVAVREVWPVSGSQP